MMYMYEYFKVTGCPCRYNQWIDALHKAISLGFYSPQANVFRCVGVTENKQTANKYTIIKEV